jgi:hypothetical protein
MTTGSRQLINSTRAIAESLKVRFCTKCNLTKSVDGGKTKTLLNGRTRWECASCVAATTPGRFAAKGK